MEDSISIELSDKEVCHFRAQGYLKLGQMTTDFELTWLKDIHDRIIQALTGYTPVELEHMRPDELSHIPAIGASIDESLITVIAPEKVVPDLNRTLFLRNARRVFTQLLEVEEEAFRTGWRIFCKPAHGSETPWHQDAAYRPPPHNSVSVWMPLDPATYETSCLSYIGGSHLGAVLPHYYKNDHMIAENVDTSGAVAWPRAAGEATVHHCYTLHYAGPNHTDQTRRAFVIVCQPAS